ncbi:MAG: D-Ala-D-Ala carboxypeptidase family metallohydrolase, partial [Aestuariivirga sp.]
GLTGQRGGVKQTARVPTPRAKPALVAPPVYTPPTPRMKPAVANPSYFGDVASYTPAAPVAPTPTYQNPARSFAAPATRAAEIREARAAPAQPQNFGFQAPDRPVTSMREEAARRAAASRRAEQQSQYRSPPGDQRLAQPSAPVQRQDFGFQAPARPAAGVPTPRQNPLRDTTKIRTDASFNANTDFGKISGETLSRLAALQDRYGKPITVTEGAAPGSTHVSRSQHHVDPRTGKATALDISVPTRDRARVASLAHDVGYGGIGAYGENLPNMIHVDSGKRRSWGPGGKAANIGRLTDRQLQAVLRDRTRARSVTKYAGYDD